MNDGGKKVWWAKNYRSMREHEKQKKLMSGKAFLCTIHSKLRYIFISNSKINSSKNYSKIRWKAKQINIVFSFCLFQWNFQLSTSLFFLKNCWLQASNFRFSASISTLSSTTEYKINLNRSFSNSKKKEYLLKRLLSILQDWFWVLCIISSVAILKNNYKIVRSFGYHSKDTFHYSKKKVRYMISDTQLLRLCSTPDLFLDINSFINSQWTFVSVLPRWKKGMSFSLRLSLTQFKILKRLR